MIYAVLGCLLLSILIARYVCQLRHKYIRKLGRSRITWTSHKPFKIKDSFVFGDHSGIRFEPKPSKDTFLIETSDNIQDLQQIKSTMYDVDGGFTTTIGDLEGVTKTTVSKYLGKHGIVDDVYMDDGTLTASDNKSTLENEIKNNALITVLILNYALTLFLLYGPSYYESI